MLAANRFPSGGGICDRFAVASYVRRAPYSDGESPGAAHVVSDGQQEYDRARFADSAYEELKQPVAARVRVDQFGRGAAFLVDRFGLFGFHSQPPIGYRR